MVPAEKKLYSAAESKLVYALLMTSGGIMGAYTFLLRGGVFCNAQTANVVLMAIAFGRGEFSACGYYLIPIGAYCLGALLSELIPLTFAGMDALRWETCLLACEAALLFLLGFVPLSWPDQIVQISINFIASMQYSTFRQAEGIPMATTFCTNHIRQIGICFARFLRRKEGVPLTPGIVHFGMISCFFLGGVLLSFVCRFWQEKSIWLALAPMGIALGKLVQANTVHNRILYEQSAEA